jgi:excisionase family DNA binding protein
VTNETLPPLDPRRRYAVNDACQYLQISRARLYEKIAAGELTPIKDGRRTYLSGAQLARLSRANARATLRCIA